MEKVAVMPSTGGRSSSGLESQPSQGRAGRAGSEGSGNSGELTGCRTCPLHPLRTRQVRTTRNSELRTMGRLPPGVGCCSWYEVEAPDPTAHLTPLVAKLLLRQACEREALGG